ncbi:MAG TPA: FAD binding domain-containing protein [Usitatibacter sp.]|nr:FAD binding domain-containing protein [Usitatibacter sp.]
MKPRPFTYIRPETVGEAIDALAEWKEAARVMAGGQTLIAMLNLRLVDCEAIIDISRMAELSVITRTASHIEIGAAVTQNRLLSRPDLAREVPLLAKTMPWVGHFQTRNKGTVCGSIAHADPSAELPLSLSLLGGEVVLRSKRGTRVLKAAKFHRGLLSTDRAPDELLVAVRFPLGAKGEGTGFHEVARRHGDFAIVSLGARARPEAVDIAIGGVTDRPAVRSIARADLSRLDDVVDALAAELGGYEDIHATARYRRDLVRRLARPVIDEALSCSA